MKISVGNSIKIAQGKKKITNMQMAEDFGVTRQQIYRWHNTDDLSLSKVQNFADYFGINIYKFLKLGEKQ